MDKDRKPIVRRPHVLKKLNAENLQLIERGLLGDLPDRFKPTPNFPVRGHSDELVVAKPSGILSACLPVVPDSPSPISEKLSSDDEEKSPLKKSFSFRDKFRISFFGKERSQNVDKPKWNTIVEEEKAKEVNLNFPGPKHSPKDNDHHRSKRFWFFRNRELEDKKHHSPIYTRSKSFEFLPRAIEEGHEKVKQKLTKNSVSYAFGSSDTVGDTSVDSLEYISDVYYDKVNNVALKSVKELHDLDHNSTSSVCTSASASVSSGISINIMKTDSVQDLLDEFNKTLDLFSENYLSDCEPYTRTSTELTVAEKRKSSSFNTLPTSKIVQVAKVNKLSEDFKMELTKILEMNRERAKSLRRGSVTDWFVLEDKKNLMPDQTHDMNEQNKYRRPQKKPTCRVRRISSTKYYVMP